LLIINKNAGVQLNNALSDSPFGVSFDFVVVELSSCFFVVLSVVEFSVGLVELVFISAVKNVFFLMESMI